MNTKDEENITNFIIFCTDDKSEFFFVIIMRYSKNIGGGIIATLSLQEDEHWCLLLSSWQGSIFRNRLNAARKEAGYDIFCFLLVVGASTMIQQKLL